MWDKIKGVITIILKKLRNKIKNLKEDFYSAKLEGFTRIWNTIIDIQIAIIYFTIVYLGVSFIMLNQVIAGIISLVVSIIYLLTSFFSEKVADFNADIAFAILQYFRRYGKVVTRKDWRNVRRKNRKLYKALRTKISFQYCYAYSRELAMYLQDVQLMYCTIQCDDGLSGHVVILKDNCIYCTNSKAHLDYEDYLKDSKGEVYKIFSKEEFVKESFFDEIREDLIRWCEERGAFCDPE